MTNRRTTLRLTGRQHAALRAHLFPGDGFEAAAVVLCGRLTTPEGQTLLAQQIEPVLYDDCSVRSPIQLVWPTDILPPLLHRAARKQQSLVLIHSHPGGQDFFSHTDSVNDRKLFPSIYNYLEDGAPHLSAIMLPDGRIRAREVTPDGLFFPTQRVSVVGDDLLFWDDRADEHLEDEGARLRLRQVFGQKTVSLLKRLSVAVVGCSGTGSPVVEFLSRNGVGRLVLVDDDIIEMKNLNRIINVFLEDAQNNTSKVEVLKKAILRMGFGTRVETYKSRLEVADALRAVASCDVVFGCMDSVTGRHALNKLAAMALLPYFDLGVQLKADGEGGIEKVVGATHFVQPDGASLLTRGVYSREDLEAEEIRELNPEMFERRRAEGYLSGIDTGELGPTVIGINAAVATDAVNDFLARIHPFRNRSNGCYAVIRRSFDEGIIINEPPPTSREIFRRFLALGDRGLEYLAPTISLAS